jgi:aminoglycoside phosphotransferase (APT) family kinase protein
MRPQVKIVHGHSLPELEDQVSRSLGGEFDITIDPSVLGGWSNITLLTYSQGHTFVLKLPATKGPFRSHPYTREYKVMNFLSREGLCPRPVKIGRLNDEERTPFMVTEYVKGVVRPSLTEMTGEDLGNLRVALTHLSALRPPGVKSYRKPSDYLSSIAEVVEQSAQAATSLSRNLGRLLGSFQGVVERVGDLTDSSCVWSRRTMHGDLQESNVVIQPDRVVLIDLESCSIGEPLLDLAYLFSQDEGSMLSIRHEVLSAGDESRIIERLRPLAVISAVGWSLQFLERLEAGLIEDSALAPDAGARVSRYVEDKMQYLTSLR